MSRVRISSPAFYKPFLGNKKQIRRPGNAGRRFAWFYRGSTPRFLSSRATSYNPTGIRMTHTNKQKAAHPMLWSQLEALGE